MTGLKRPIRFRGDRLLIFGSLSLLSVIAIASEETGPSTASLIQPALVTQNQQTPKDGDDLQQQKPDGKPKYEAPIEGLVNRWLHWGGNIHNRISRDQSVEATTKTSSKGHSEESLPQSQIPSFITGAWNSNQTNHFPLDYSIQMMHRAEVDLISSYLRPTDVYIEYGSGGSTINFSPLVARAYSVEHNCEWADFISRSVREHVHHEAYSNLNIHCVSITPGFRGWGTLSNFEHANYKQFREYVDAIENFKEPSFDRVFIDGRARLACALKVLPYLKVDSLVFIHDFFSRTSHYGAVLRYYDEVARVLAFQNQDPTLGPIDEPQGLIVLRRSDDRNITPPTADEIDAIYDSIDWRLPFGPPLTSIHGYVHYYASFLNFGRWSRARNPRALVRLIARDMFRVSCFMIFTLFAVHAFRLCFKRPSWLKSKQQRVNTKAHQSDIDIGSHATEAMNPSAGNTSTTMTGGVTTIPRYFETEAMKSASARRKRISTSQSRMSV